MADLSVLKTAAQRVVDEVAGELRELSLAIHAHPELNFQEVYAHTVLTDYLERKGFAVRRGAYALPTAFEAVAGSGQPRIAVLCEYDALPEIGHACGHNLIATAGVAVSVALKQALDAGSGTVVVLGTPAEEGGAGKAYLIERGAFTDLDAAMMLHPFPFDSVWPHVTALHALEVEFFGKSAHAAALPHEGINALDALVLAYNALSVLRQQIRSNERIHGIITKGGTKPNIIPDHTAGEFYVRAKDDHDLQQLKDRVIACFEGAARATGCRLEYRWIGKPYSHLTTNGPLAETFAENARLLGKHLPDRDHDPAAAYPFSTDMGNVSHVVPAIHPLFAIPTRGGNHTPEFAEAAATPDAHAAMLTAAKALAMTALDLFYRPDLLARVKQEFRAAHDA